MSVLTRWSLLLLTAGATVLAAEPARAAAVGAVMGLGRVGIAGDTPPNTEYGAGTGVIAGVQAEMALSENIALSIQPVLNTRRTTLTTADGEDSSGERVIDLDLDYVSVPLVVKFQAAGGRTYFAGGLDVAFLTSARLSSDGVDEDVESLFHSTDVGALLGFGVVFPVGRPHVTTELRYVQGLVNLSGDPGAGAVRDLPDRFHSGGWQLTAGILFPLGAR